MSQPVHEEELTLGPIVWSKDKATAIRYRNYMAGVIKKNENDFHQYTHGGHLIWGKHVIFVPPARPGTTIATSYHKVLSRNDEMLKHGEEQDADDILGPELYKAFNSLLDESLIPVRSEHTMRYRYHTGGSGSDKVECDQSFIYLGVSAERAEIHIPNAKEFVERFDAILKSNGLDNVFVVFSVTDLR